MSLGAQERDWRNDTTFPRDQRPPVPVVEGDDSFGIEPAVIRVEGDPGWRESQGERPPWKGFVDRDFFKMVCTNDFGFVPVLAELGLLNTRFFRAFEHTRFMVGNVGVIRTYVQSRLPRRVGIGKLYCIGRLLVAEVNPGLNCWLSVGLPLVQTGEWPPGYLRSQQEVITYAANTCLGQTFISPQLLSHRLKEGVEKLGRFSIGRLRRLELVAALSPYAQQQAFLNGGR